jgi:uncharacterized protein (TIGR02996 family)
MNPEAFVAAISEKPDDDTPRLVCADWLEEHGQPQRAELIRAQIELARRGPKDKRANSLRKRVAELLAEHADEWAGPLLDRVNKVVFRRGFVERVILTAADFLDSSKELFALAPIREAVFVKVSSPALARLARCLELARLALLDFRDIQFSGEELAAFLGSPKLRGLQTFALRLRSYGDSVIEGLTHAKHPPPLATLDLYDAGVHAEAIVILGGWPGVARLQNLILGGSDLGEGAAVSLARSSYLSGLRSLHLVFAHLGDEDARSLAASPHLRALERLDLRHNDFTDEGIGLLRKRFGRRVQL